MEKFDISKCPMWEWITPAEQSELIQDLEYTLNRYRKGETIARQGDSCRHLFLLTKGSVKTEMITESGGQLTIEKIEAIKPLASAFIFAKENRFPVDVTALDDCEIVTIPKNELLRLFNKYPRFLERYIEYNANITQFLSGKLQVLTIKTIRGKLAHYFLSILNKNRASNPKAQSIILDKNQTELANYFGVTRPSLARTISEMEHQGLIIANRKEIIIVDERALRDSIN